MKATEIKACPRCGGKGRYAVREREVGNRKIYPETYGWRALHTGMLLDERGNILLPGHVLVVCDVCSVEGVKESVKL